MTTAEGWLFVLELYNLTGVAGVVVSRGKLCGVRGGEAFFETSTT